MCDVDPETHVGTCSICGPGVRAYNSKRGDGSERWRCSRRVRAQESVNRFNKGLDPLAERIRKMQVKGVKITLDQFEELTAAQDGHCALCGRVPKQLHVDHDHGTGRVRALLCSTCNTGLGKFGDDPARLRAAADYLDAHS